MKKNNNLISTLIFVDKIESKWDEQRYIAADLDVNIIFYNIISFQDFNTHAYYLIND